MYTKVSIKRKVLISYSISLLLLSSTPTIICAVTAWKEISELTMIHKEFAVKNHVPKDLITFYLDKMQSSTLNYNTVKELVSVKIINKKIHLQPKYLLYHQLVTTNDIPHFNDLLRLLCLVLINNSKNQAITRNYEKQMNNLASLFELVPASLVSTETPYFYPSLLSLIVVGLSSALWASLVVLMINGNIDRAGIGIFEILYASTTAILLFPIAFLTTISTKELWTESLRTTRYEKEIQTIRQHLIQQTLEPFFH